MKDFISMGILIGAAVYSATNTLQAIYTTGKYIDETETTLLAQRTSQDFTITLRDGRCIMTKKQETAGE